MNDETFMRLAMVEAQKGSGRTRPNPAVGCVIVKQGEVVASGYHHRAGEDHAEVDALKKIDASSLDDATMYVTLEPCCTHGRTPPCTDAILSTPIKRVVIGTADTNPNVAGTGIKKLEAAGIDVTVGVLASACRAINHGYFSIVERGRPWVVVKYAMSLDGKIATLGGDSKWITNDEARARVGALRNRFDAVCVGTETLVLDNPRLTSRIEGGRNPARVLVDRLLKAPLSHNALDGAVQTILFVSEEADPQKREALEARGLSVIDSQFVDGALDVKEALHTLRDHEIGTLLVEGGGTLLGSFAAAGVIDEIYAFVAPKIFAGSGREPFVSDGPETMEQVAHLSDVETEVLGDNVLVHGYWVH